MKKREQWNFFLIVLLCMMLLLVSGCKQTSEQGLLKQNNSIEGYDSEVGMVPVTGELLDYENSVTKKGVASSRYNSGSADHIAKLEVLNISWYYNWGIKPPSVETALDYVPMIWGYNDANASNIKKIKNGYENRKYTNLLTFNEPDMGGEAGGCEMSVKQAIKAWPKLQEIGIRLGSPAVAADYAWLDEFMSKCKELGYRVDFLSVHCYQDVTDTASVSNLRVLLSDLYSKYGLPIWLTEFGCIDVSAWSGGVNEDYTAESSAKYLTRCTAMLEGLGFVERYSFFLDNYGGGANPYEGRYSRLYDDNDELNIIGKTYIEVNSELPLIIQNINPPGSETGQEYKLQIVAQGGERPYTFSATGLPQGLSINEETGLISGTYQKGGARMVIIVTDAKGQTNRAIYDVKDRSN
ncbi:hypothetical protein HNQ56_001397 [Anaerotaenia torta]|uniref:glycosyl hydrolase n=1 Tax=Anaerotaenia torta TaxID=433293 RepID=UPI003D1BE16F